LQERDCSLRLYERAILFRTKRAEPAFRAGGQRSGKQCSDTKDFVARNCREATRGAGSGRINTTEINAANPIYAVLVRGPAIHLEQECPAAFKQKLTPG
jgi:hypothetical protein